MRLKSRPKEPSPSLTRVGANFYSSVKQQDYSASVWLRRKDKLEHVRAARSPGPRPGTWSGGGRSARAGRRGRARGPGRWPDSGTRAAASSLRPGASVPALSGGEGPGCGEERGGEVPFPAPPGPPRTSTSPTGFSQGSFAPRSWGAFRGGARRGTATAGLRGTRRRAVVGSRGSRRSSGLCHFVQKLPISESATVPPPPTRPGSAHEPESFLQPALWDQQLAILYLSPTREGCASRGERRKSERTALPPRNCPSAGGAGEPGPRLPRARASPEALQALAMSPRGSPFWKGEVPPKTRLVEPQFPS